MSAWFGRLLCRMDLHAWFVVGASWDHCSRCGVTR